MRVAFQVAGTCAQPATARGPLAGGRGVMLCGAALALSFRKASLPRVVLNHSSKYLPELQLIATLS